MENQPEWHGGSGGLPWLHENMKASLTKPPALRAEPFSLLR